MLGVPVLLFHHVGPAHTGVPPELTVSPRAFERFAGYLAATGFHTIGLGELAAWLHGSQGLPSRSVVVTFDDAYADLSIHALPAMKRHGQRAVVFVPAALVGGTNAWDGGESPIMSAGEIRRWADEGFEFAAHGRTHTDLRSVGPGERERELAGARHELEEILARPVTAVAYPYGGHDEVVRAAAVPHYALGFVVGDGLNRRGADPLRLRRTMVQRGDSLVDFALRCRLGCSPVQRVRARAIRVVRRGRHLR